MLRSAASKVMWVGRATVFLVGLAVILALLFGAATTAMSATGKPFILGKRNVADQTSKLIKRGAGAALSLQVQDGQPPMKVDSSGKVDNLNADLLDGKEASGFYEAGTKVEDSKHADQADSAATAQDADNAANAADSEKLDGLDSTEFYEAGSKVADSQRFDGKEPSAFLGADQTAADSDKLDGTDSSGFVRLVKIAEFTLPSDSGFTVPPNSCIHPNIGGSVGSGAKAGDLTIVVPSNIDHQNYQSITYQGKTSPMDNVITASICNVAPTEVQLANISAKFIVVRP